MHISLFVVAISYSAFVQSPSTRTWYVVVSSCGAELMENGCHSKGDISGTQTKQYCPPL